MTASLDHETLARLSGGATAGGTVDVACPLCSAQHNPKKRVLRIWARAPNGATYYCVRCGAKGHASDDRARSKLTGAELAALKRKKAAQRWRQGEHEEWRRQEANALWREADPIAGTPAERYLVNHRKLDVRGLDLWHCLRWNAVRGCIVALMTDPISNEELGIHRTFLDGNHHKTERKMLGRKGVIRLSPDESVAYGLSIAEGVEDALALILAGQAPAWSVCDKGGVSAFPVLAGIDCLSIWTDSDALKEAHDCAHRWRKASREAAVIPPPLRRRRVS